MGDITPGRGGAIAANVAALASLVPVALHQFGAISHLPDPPLAICDSDLITQSKMAHPLGIPDSVLGISSYAITLALLANAPRSPVVKKLAAVKLAGDGCVAVANAIRQVVVFRKVCSWCLLTVAATGWMVVAGRKYFV